MDPGSICWKRWTKSLTVQRQNEKRWQEMKTCSQCLALSPTVLSVTRRLLAVPNEEFKALSYDGAIYMGKGKYRDAGNWTYSAIYLLLWESALGTELEAVLRELASHYTSLLPDWPYTSASLNTRGNVIEAILEECRYTGPAVDKHERGERIAVHEMIKKLCNAMEDCVKSFQTLSGCLTPNGRRLKCL